MKNPSYAGVYAFGRYRSIKDILENGDPSNRLVASTLEQRWNDTLIELQDVKEQIDDLQQQSRQLTSQQRDEALALAQDLPKLWNNTTTAWKDKKRILQLLIRDITVKKPHQNAALLQVRWQGSRRTREMPSRSKVLSGFATSTASRVSMIGKPGTSQSRSLPSTWASVVAWSTIGSTELLSAIARCFVVSVGFGFSGSLATPVSVTN